MAQQIGFDGNGTAIYFDDGQEKPNIKPSQPITKPSVGHVGFDFDGKPITQGDQQKIAPTDGPTFNGPPTIGSRLREFGRNTVDAVKNLAPMGAAALGTIQGAAGGEALFPAGGGIPGGIIGGIAAYTAAKKAGDIATGKSAKVTGTDLSEAVLNQAFESGAPAVQHLVSKYGEEIIGPLYTKFIEHGGVAQNNLPVDVKAMHASPNLTRTTGDAMGSAPLKNLEQYLGGKKLVDIRNTQRVEQKDTMEQLLHNYGTTLKTRPINSQMEGQLTLADRIASSKGSYQQAYNDFDKQVIQPNTHEIQVVTGHESSTPSSVIDPATNQPYPPTPGKPITEPKTVELPIYLSQMSTYTNMVNDELKGFLGSDQLANLPPAMQNKFKYVSSLVNDMMEPTQVLGAGGQISTIPVKDYATVKEIRTQIGNLLDNKGLVGRPRALLSGISNALDKDISGTIQALPNGADALELRTKADLAFGEHQDRFKPILNRVFQKDPSLGKFADPDAMFKAADTDPAVARKIKIALGPQDGILKTGLMSKAFDDSYDAANQVFDVDGIIRKLHTESYKTTFTPTELDTTEEVLRGLRTQNPNLKQAGGAGLQLKGGRVALALSSTAVGAGIGKAEGGNNGAGIGAGAGLLAFIAPSVFVNNILLNKTYSKIAAKLPYIAADLPQAKLMGRVLMEGLQGAQVAIAIGDGKEEEGIVGKNGNVQLK